MIATRTCSDRRFGSKLLVILVLLTGCVSSPKHESKTPIEHAAQSVEPACARNTAPIQARREQAIAAYLDYLERYPDSPDKRRITRRIADLMLDSAAESAARADNTEPGTGPKSASVKARLHSAIDLYERLLREDPQTDQDTELLYQLARAYEKSGQPQRAMVIFERLITSHTGRENRLYADAQFRRGEILFGQKAFARAEDAYRTVVDLGHAVPVFEQASYKLGWSLFKQGEYTEALRVFFSLLDRRVPPEGSFESYSTSLSGAELEQVDDVLRAISLCFSYLAGADSIAAHFIRHGERIYERRIYLDLAELYERKELFTEAAATYLALAQRAPLDRQSPRLLIEAIRLYRLAGSTNKVLETQAALVRGYGQSSAFWEQRSPQACPNTLLVLRSSLVALADQYHRRASTTNDAADYHEAEQWYRAYLSWFDDTKDTPAMHYGLAELLFDRGQYTAAAMEFERIAYEREGFSRAAEAALSAIVAHERSDATDVDLNNENKRTRKTNSAIRFAEVYSDHPQAATVFAQAGVELLERNDARTAIRVSETILQTAKSSANALRQSAWSVMGQARYALGEHVAAEHAYREALRLTGSTDPRRRQLKKRLASTVYKQAEQKRAIGNERESAALFLRAAMAAPGTSVATSAEYDAASALLALKKWDEATKILERFRANHPTHALRHEAAKKLAFAYNRNGRYLDAAATYRQLGTGPGEDTTRRAALMSAADLYEQGGNSRRAIEALVYYVREFLEPPVAVIEVYRKLAALEKNHGDEEQARHWLRKVIEADRAAGNARNQRTRTLAAHSALELAAREVESFRRIPLVVPLQKSLSRKLRAMRKALGMLENVTHYQIGPVNAAATRQIGDLYRQLGEALSNSERPTGLDRDAIAQYESQLEEQAAGFEHKAKQIEQSHLRQVSAGRTEPSPDLSAQRRDQFQPNEPGQSLQGESTTTLPERPKTSSREERAAP